MSPGLPPSASLLSSVGKDPEPGPAVLVPQRGVLPPLALLPRRGSQTDSSPVLLAETCSRQPLRSRSITGTGWARESPVARHVRVHTRAHASARHTGAPASGRRRPPGGPGPAGSLLSYSCVWLYSHRKIKRFPSKSPPTMRLCPGWVTVGLWPLRPGAAAPVLVREGGGARDSGRGGGDGAGEQRGAPSPPRPAPCAAAPRTWPWQPPTLPPHAAASARPRIAEEGRWRCRGDAIFEPPGFAACAPVRPPRGVRGPEVSGTRKLDPKARVSVSLCCEGRRPSSVTPGARHPTAGPSPPAGIPGTS